VGFLLEGGDSSAKEEEAFSICGYMGFGMLPGKFD
jgi:hypothetical protein